MDHATGSHTPTTTSPGNQNLFAGVLVLVMALAIMLPPALGALGPFLIDDLGLNRSQIGILASVASLASALLAPPLGRIVDRYVGRGLISVVFVVVAVGLFSVAAAPSFPWLVAAVFVAGAGMALANPATNRLIAAHGDPQRRGLLVGLKQSGVQVGATLAGVTLPAVATVLGWRGAIAIVALFAVLAAATGWLAVPRSFAPGAEPSAKGTPGAAPDTSEREIHWLAVFTFFMAAGTATLVSYLPLYSFDEVGYSAVVAGLVGATLAFVGIAARIGWARFADRIGDPWRVLVWLASGAAAAQLLLLLAPRVPILLWISAAALGASMGAWHAVVQVTIVRRGLHGAGRRTGLVHLTFSAGMVAGPALFGISVDRLEAYAPGWLAVLVLNLLGAAMAWGWRRRHMPVGATN